MAIKYNIAFDHFVLVGGIRKLSASETLRHQKKENFLDPFKLYFIHPPADG